jgi:hypothetical protein
MCRVIDGESSFKNEGIPRPEVWPLTVWPVWLDATGEATLPPAAPPAPLPRPRCGD